MKKLDQKLTEMSIAQEEFYDDMKDGHSSMTQRFTAEKEQMSAIKNAVVEDSSSSDEGSDEEDSEEKPARRSKVHPRSVLAAVQNSSQQVRASPAHSNHHRAEPVHCTRRCAIAHAAP